MAGKVHLIWIDYQLINFTEDATWLIFQMKIKTMYVDAATLDCIRADGQKGLYVKRVQKVNTKRYLKSWRHKQLESKTCHKIS